MRKLLLGLSVLFSTIIIMFLPAGTMKAKAAGNIIDGEITWTEIIDGTHTGDYVGRNTTITGYITGNQDLVRFKCEISPYLSDSYGGEMSYANNGYSVLATS